MILDTHTWLWWISTPELLSKTAYESIEDWLNAGRPLTVSCISTWEVALLVSKGRLSLSIPVSAWVSRCEALSKLEFAAVTNSIALRSVDLDMHSDPADRIIVATAFELNLPLVTKDQKLRELAVPTIW